MKVSHREGLANHSDPALWRCSRKGALQALTGECVGRASSRERLSFRGADDLSASEGHTASIALAGSGLLIWATAHLGGFSDQCQL